MTGAHPPRPLIIGYGNPLRGDDGVGWRIADELDGDARAAEFDVIAAHQLTPELAEDFAAASLVILVDAQIDGTASPRPGHWTITRLAQAPVPAPVSAPVSVPAHTPAVDRGGSDGHRGWTHHCTPAALARLAQQVYGSVAPVTVVGVGVLSVEPGDRLSEPVARAIPAIVDAVLAVAGAGLPDPSEDGCHA